MKKWYKSKTLLVGVLEILSPLGAFLVDESLMDEAYIVAVMGVLTVVLRLVTDKGIVK